MMLPSFLDPDPPPWEVWVIPAAGLLAALVALFVGRHLLARRRIRRPAPVAADGPLAADGPVHDPFDHGSITERRGSVRRKGNHLEVLISDADAKQEPVRGWVIDRSMGGLCLLLNDALVEGTVLSIKPRQSPPGMPWVQASVCNCKRERNGYEIGCQFVKTPPWGVMLLFG